MNPMIVDVGAQKAFRECLTPWQVPTNELYIRSDVLPSLTEGFLRNPMNLVSESLAFLPFGITKSKTLTPNFCSPRHVPVACANHSKRTPVGVRLGPDKSWNV